MVPRRDGRVSIGVVERVGVGVCSAVDVVVAADVSPSMRGAVQSEEDACPDGCPWKDSRRRKQRGKEGHVRVECKQCAIWQLTCNNTSGEQIQTYIILDISIYYPFAIIFYRSRM